MTAIGVSTPVLASPRTVRPGGAPLTHLRLTARGRRVLALLAALPATVALAIAILSGGSALASRDSGVPTGGLTTITVSPGDSLWGIAQELAPERDPRDVVDEIVRLNALGSVELRAGQTLAIPAALSVGR